MTATPSTAVPVLPRSRSVLTPLSLTSVAITGGFWAEKQTLNREAIIPHCDHSLERVGWVENFRAALRGTLETERVGRLFTDSEIYKTMEAMAWENAREDSPEFRSRLEELAGLLEKAQQEDGYLNTFYGYEGGPGRYSDMEWGHELYCYGHLLQAAVAGMRANGPETLRAIAVRVADHICDTFGPDGLQTLCGHPEIETALVELYRETGNRRYLEQAKIFIDRRGHQILGDTMYGGRDYYQDNVPLRQADVLVGHAVRALYLAAGAIDVAVETGDNVLLQKLKEQYDRTLERRTYLTGGMGSNHHGETFGEDFELPSERAYAETCAAIASVHVAWRLLLATGQASYADVIERTLYNSVISSPSFDGKSFFYVNTLHRRSPGIEPEPGVPSLRRTDGTRAAWFTTSCCPTNIARTLSSLGGYAATVNDTGIQIHQYIEGTISHTMEGNRHISLSMETAYPADGRISLRIDEADGAPWALSLRIPGWSANPKISINGESAEVTQGTTVVTRAWKKGDTVSIDLEVAPRFTYPDSRIDALRGTAAVECGPLVYCLESPDQPGLDLDLMELDLSSPLIPSEDRSLAPGAASIQAAGFVTEGQFDGWPYGSQPTSPVKKRPVALTFSPYFLWANRGTSTMRVWVPATTH
jgi:DUF1680 family protein